MEAPLELPLVPGGRLRLVFTRRVGTLDPPARRALLIAPRMPRAVVGASPLWRFAPTRRWRGARSPARRLWSVPMPVPPALRDVSLEADATALLRRLAGPDAHFREHQLEAVPHLVADRARVLCVQRTGWGKSAVYFLATALLRARG